VRLYHFSEQPGIEVFRPRIALTSNVQDSAYVWAIDEWHAAMYLLPRDCPRACFWAGPDTTPDDAERWLGGVQARMVIVVESGWLDRILTTTLYRYRMPADTFDLLDATAGHWVSTDAVVPTGVDEIGDLLEALVGSGVELRFTPLLTDLWSRVIRSSLKFSGTRLRNARQPGP